MTQTPKLRECWPVAVFAGAASALTVAAIGIKYPPRYPAEGEALEFLLFSGSYIFGSIVAWTFLAARIRNRSVSKLLLAAMTAPVLGVIGSLCLSSLFVFYFAAFVWPTSLVVTVFVYVWLPRRAVPGECAQCRYSLVGNTSRRCPECGRALE